MSRSRYLMYTCNRYQMCILNNWSSFPSEKPRGNEKGVWQMWNFYYLPAIIAFCENWKVGKFRRTCCWTTADGRRHFLFAWESLYLVALDIPGLACVCVHGHLASSLQWQTQFATAKIECGSDIFFWKPKILSGAEHNKRKAERRLNNLNPSQTFKISKIS